MKVFNHIRLDNLRGDLFGGLTAAVIALPMALAFGVASGAGPEAGLYGAILVGLFAALFGGTPTLMSEPTGPMTVVMTAVIAKLIATNPENGMAMAFTVVMLAGVFQMVFSALRLGRYVTLMPYIVISGFMSGIGLILIILQLPALLGHASPGGGVMGSLGALPSLLADVRLPELGLALLTLGFLFFMPRRLRRLVPPQLVALVVGTLLSLWLLGADEVRRIGVIDTGLPSLQLPVFSAEQWESILVDALVLAMLGSIDALLTSMIADSLTRQEHHSDKELMGQGLGNLVSGLFGGLPGAGATMGTVVNIQAGGRTALAGLVRAGILIVVVLWAAGLTAHIPLAVLAGIAFKVGVDIIDWGFIRRAHRVSTRGALIMYGVVGLTVFVDLIVAVGIGLFVANILTIRRLAELQEETVCVCAGGGEQPTETCLGDEEVALLQGGGGRLALLHLSGPLIFGAAQALRRQEPGLEDAGAIVIDLAEVPHLGVTTSLALEGIVRDAVGRGAPVYLGGTQPQPRRRLERLGLHQAVPEEQWVADRLAGLQGAAARIGVTAP
jgi:SulP family sulfate permease